MPVRDPSSADPNAQAPADHPDAQVRVDQSVKLTGVQAPKYAQTDAERAVLAQLAEQNARQQDEANAAMVASSNPPSGDQSPPEGTLLAEGGQETPEQVAQREAGEAALAAELAAHAPLSQTDGDPIPDGEVKPDPADPSKLEG